MSSSVFGLSAQARCIASFKGTSSFVVPTTTWREDNEVHVLSVTESDDGFSIKPTHIVGHPGEVSDVVTNSNEQDLFITTYSQAVRSEVLSRAAIWKLQSQESADLILRIDAAKSQLIRKVTWIPEMDDHLFVVESQSIHKEQIVDGTLSNSWAFDFNKTSSETERDFSVHTGQCSPLQTNIVAVSKGGSVYAFDTRQSKPIWTNHATSIGICRALCFNPFNLHYLATGGDDCKLKFWDCRNTSIPSVVMKGHNHWIHNIQYHPTHDELVLSSGSDGKVMLWNIVSISSMEVEDGLKLPSDALAKLYEEHEDSVYGIAWSDVLIGSSWIFASLSYDGRVVINTVPQEYADLTKY